MQFNKGSLSSQFYYDGQNRMVRIVDKKGDKTTADTSFVWCGEERCAARDNLRDGSPVRGRYFAQGEIQGTTPYYIVTDHLGSVRQLVTPRSAIKAQYDYDPYGVRLRTDAGNVGSSYGFAGLFNHAGSNIDFAVYRGYDSRVGRWLNRDPIGEKAEVNLYGYVAENPINAIDPSGHFAIIDNLIAGAVGVTAGVLFSWTACEDYTFKNAVLDFGLGFATQGLSALNKLRLIARSGRGLTESGLFSRLVPGGGLAAHEAAGGHLLARHIGKTEGDLAARLASEPALSAASTFTSRAEAEAAIASALHAQSAAVDAWTLAGAQGRLVINGAFNGGLVLQRGAATALPGTGVRAVLEGTGGGSWRIITGYPIP